jgi:hypothetical protein
MHASGKFRSQNFVDHAMALNSAHSREGLANRNHFEMTLGTIGHVVAMTFVQHFQML